jgi:hypothetical protein
VDNTAGWSGGGYSSFDAPAAPIARTIFAYNHATSGSALHQLPYWNPPSFECCVFWGHDPPEAWGNVDYPVGSGGNIEADPLFCNWENGDFGLLPDSPCLPENNECGVLIGADDAGCDSREAGGVR